MKRFYSPLRYPGGKSFMSCFLSNVIEKNNLLDGIYVEPFAGGSGAALYLLFLEYVNKIILNDLDKNIYKFWKSVINHPEKLIKLINDTSINLFEWEKQKNIFLNEKDYSDLEVAFSAFFLNRCNRSGVLYGGPIGGRKQNGKWKINARFNKKNLIERIEKIALYEKRIDLYNMDGISFIKKKIKPKLNLFSKLIIYLDPPYFHKGKQLYYNYFSYSDHKELAMFLKKQSCFKWILSYDDVLEIREFYKEYRIKDITVNYSAGKTKFGKEIIIFSENCVIPN